MNASRILVIGPMPPPVHGYSLVTAMIAERLRGVADIRLLDTSPNELDRSPRYHAKRLWRVVKGLWCVLSQRPRGDTIYLAIAGGMGIAYDILFAAAARLCRYRLFIHHHAFTYINRRSRLASVFVAFAGRDAVHICLCPHMATLLRQRYAGIEHVRVASNAALIEPSGSVRAVRTGRLSIGFLSNLVLEKGLDVVFDLFRILRAGSLDVRLVIAGPPADRESQLLIDAARREFGEAFDYRGSVYGPSKAKFFDDIDIFLFPTRYPNEAEPLVVLEALSAGLPVIATPRGCIAADVSPSMGTIFRDDEYIDGSARLLHEWIEDPEKLGLASEMARARAHHLFQAAQQEVAELMSDMARAAPRSRA